MSLTRDDTRLRKPRLLTYKVKAREMATQKNGDMSAMGMAQQVKALAVEAWRPEFWLWNPHRKLDAWRASVTPALLWGGGRGQESHLIAAECLDKSHCDTPA